MYTKYRLYRGIRSDLVNLEVARVPVGAHLAAKLLRSRASGDKVADDRNERAEDQVHHGQCNARCERGNQRNEQECTLDGPGIGENSLDRLDKLILQIVAMFSRMHTT